MQPVDRVMRETTLKRVLIEYGLVPELMGSVIEYYGLVVTCEHRAVLSHRVALAKPDSPRDARTIPVERLPVGVDVWFRASLDFAFWCGCRVVRCDGYVCADRLTNKAVFP
jgi:hypothetical protein